MFCFSFFAQANYNNIYQNCNKKKSTEEISTCMTNTIKFMQESVVPDIVQKAQGKLDETNIPCPTSSFNNSNDIIPSAIQYSSPVAYQNLIQKIKSKGQEYTKNIISQFTQVLETSDFPKECLTENSKICEILSNNIQILKERLVDLVDIAYGPDSTQSTQAQALCFGCDKPNPTKDIENLDTTLKNLQEQSQCENPQPGKTKIVNTGKPLHANYTLKKEPDGSFSIPFNIEFAPDKDYDGPVPKDQAGQYYMQKAQECMQKANSKMLGPNGEKLKFVLKSPPPKEKDPCQGQSTHKIKIGSQVQRSNVGKYASNIDCPTITHEILHLTGLCDEYKEEQRGYYVNSHTGEVKGSNWEQTSELDKINTDFKLAFDCRVTNKNSIMSNQYERWNNVFEADKNKSLLNPGQFNRILYGTCEEKNKLFNECSALAYQSSVQDQGCMAQKEKCETNNMAKPAKANKVSRIK